MKDIDFDELDKAVNSLMARTQDKGAPVSVGVSNSTPTTSSTDNPSVPLTAASDVSPGTMKPKSDVAINPDTQPAVTLEPKNTASRTAAPAARRSGRFMDVVPKKPMSPVVSPRPTSREGAEIMPRAAASIESASLASMTAPTTVVPESQPEQPVSVEETAPKNDWPDPIEVATAKDPLSKDTTDAKSSESSDQVHETEDNANDQPLTSPFLPNAKVEKRPLGSPTSNVPMLAPESELQIATPDDSDAQLPVKPNDIVPETPEEFGGDIMQVEADTHMGLPKTENIHGIEKQTEDEPAEEIADVDKKTTLVVADEEAAVESPSASGRISIPPQYREQPSTGDKESGAIYDTSTYHQPLSHPTKKKSGWLWVLWIILILIIGAAAGAGLYFMGAI